jgi:hypothetical protein
MAVLQGGNEVVNQATAHRAFLAGAGIDFEYVHGCSPVNDLGCTLLVDMRIINSMSGT